MWDMRCVNNSGGSLSKGTQSEGLISDTSTEELTSSSSVENLKEEKTSKQIIAKDSKGDCNELRDSIDLINFEPINSSLQIPAQCQSYIKWGVLLTFGVLLWVALWVTDIFNPNPFLNADLAAAKKITLKAGTEKKTGPPAWWFLQSWNYVWNSIISISTLEIIIFLSCIIILAFLGFHTRNKWEENNRFHYETEQDETGNNFHLNILKELALEEPKKKNYRNNLSKFSHGDVRNVISCDNIEEKCTQCSSQGEISLMKNYISHSLKSSCNSNNVKKQSIQLKDATKYCNLSRRSNNLASGIVTSELIFNKPSYNLSCMSSMCKNDETKSNLEQSSFSCSIFNKSTSFVSEKIETWFEIPHSDPAEKVMHSFDVELEELFRTKNNPLCFTFGGTSQSLQKLKNNSINCESNRQSKAVAFNADHNKGIVSSSPAFKKFLMNLAKDKTF